MKNISNSNEYIIVDPPLDMLHGDSIDFNKFPRVSFCIPTFNNEDTLDGCLNSIISQNYPDIEIVIVDGHSRDRTLEIAKKYTNKIYFDGGTLGSARQTSIQQSTGSILALIDSDIVIPHRDWLINSVRYFNYNCRVSTVWPINVAPPGAKRITRLYFNLWRIIFEDAMNKKRGLFGGGNALILRKCLEEVGGISKTLHWGEDYDWARKLKDRGYSVVFIRDPLYHDTMRSILEFSKKQFTGARTFTKTGFGLMGKTAWEVFFEQVILGSKGMVRGLIIYKDESWLIFPMFLFIRIIAYAYNYTKNFIKNRV